MQASVLTEVLLPLALAIIMFGMGLSLTKDDFLRLWRIPKPIFVGIFGQLILLPVIAYGVAIAFDLSEPLAIGLMVLAACPGGTTSNVICQLARANLALSVSLTAVTTLVCVFSTPFIIQFAIEHFTQSDAVSFSLLGTTIGLFVVTLLPVILGLLGRHYYPNSAMRSETFFRRFSTLFLLCMIVLITYQERNTLANSFDAVFGAALALNLTAVAAGVILGLVFKLQEAETVTLGIEVGIQNSAMAILIALTFLGDTAYATSAGVYGLVMFIGAALLVLGAKFVRKKRL
ncbi:bile acid:sodium symporter family protein [Alteromonadaceae bacterium M269]|nr:bile acid:sodium symporter family protein [Alteromonadaceae bacterium M269]